MMERTDLPILLASQHASLTETESEPLDRIRMQKGIFLLEMKGPTAWQQFYKFSPYDWGPFSRALMGDLDLLVNSALLEKRPVPNARYHSYGTTTRGEKKAGELWAGLSQPERVFISAVRHFVTSRSFSRLLRDIYAEFPAFAVRSRFAG
jgi:hypothetical protein